MAEVLRKLCSFSKRWAN